MIAETVRAVGYVVAPVVGEEPSRCQQALGLTGVAAIALFLLSLGLALALAHVTGRITWRR